MPKEKIDKKVGYWASTRNIRYAGFTKVCN